MRSDRLAVCGIPVDSCGPDPVLRDMNQNIRTVRERRYIAITNTESMYHATRRREHLEYIRKASYSLCDGIGVVVAGMLRGRRITRLNGPVILLKCCEYGIERGWRHFFFGGKPGVPEMLSDQLTKRFPGLITAGTYSPPFSPVTPEQDREIVARLNAARADILWVGLGLPKQERWIAEHLDTVDVPWKVGVGAAFDYHAGTVKWAPPFIRAMGLEWLYRAAREPRMIRRIGRSVSFVVYAAIAG